MPYIGKSPSAGVRQRYQYTATASQTTFSGTDLGNLTLNYTDNNFVDVFQNGVLLKGGGNDYTATSGTSVVLATGASASDVIEIIVYDVFSVGNFYSRTDSDSRYVNVDGDTMTGNLAFASGNGIDFSAASGSASGSSSALLDDYEEGTFTPSFLSIDLSGTTFTSQTGKYVKVGRLVLCNIYIVVGSGLDTSDASAVSITGFPFTIDATTESAIVTLGREVDLLNSKEDTFRNARATGNAVVLFEGDGDTIQYQDVNSSGELQMSVMYMATA